MTGRMDSLRAAMVIARRDYVASVWSRTFLFFLIGPLLPLLAGGLFGAVGANVDKETGPPTIAVILPADEANGLVRARVLIAERLGEGALPQLRLVKPAGEGEVQARALLADNVRRSSAVLSGTLEKPVLTGPRGVLRDLRGEVGLLLDRTRSLSLARLFPDGDAAAAFEEPVTLTERPVDAAAGSDARARSLVARIGQVVLMFLTLLLTGMMLSNMVEEKSNKVIEVLTAAVPVDGIFFGKLVAMLGLSLTGIAVWGGAAALALIAFAGPAVIPPPAVGWPIYLALGLIYFAATYLLIGAVFLGIGAQANSVREVQTMSMPLTMAQLGLVAFASAAVNDPDGPLALAAAILPWSSPYAMLARAAGQPTLWPHLLAILWQAAWVALTIRLTARWFRVSVLKSGPPSLFARLFRRRRSAPISG
ncbi:ABC transporter permease [Sphingomonas jatrophae]|uniref:ABC-2 type transport system permease protein n=1 Tax=Sphingomonas jatrophae TaxID=1166337 RepID=A0A1I6JQT6_9SPHN|nr:ABC transporter permease [Sphingomonas jatrophae]SFR81281.1 ABC-2 type transport system permease protein [Sphingomonas jatrophae]